VAPSQRKDFDGYSNPMAATKTQVEGSYQKKLRKIFIALAVPTAKVN